MALQFNNTPSKKKIPIKRNCMFFGDEDYDLEMEYAQEYLEHDANQTIILYMVDLEKTKVDDIYKEAKKDAIMFKTPIELPVIYEIEDAEIKSYNTKIQKGIYAKPGKLTFSVLLKTLEENDCDINRGDYIGIQIDEYTRKYWVVTDDGRVQTYSNKNTIYGIKPYFRKIEAAPVDETEFQG